MKEDEKIILYIKQLTQDLANQEIDNPWIVQFKQDARDRHIEDLTRHYGYKDEEAVWDKVNELFTNERDQSMEREHDFEKRQAESLKQEMKNEISKNTIKVSNEKRRGYRM